jgi:hypothetical protein
LVASDGVTTPSGGSPEDEFWQRPTPDLPAPESDGGQPEERAPLDSGAARSDATRAGGAGPGVEQAGSPWSSPGQADNPWARPGPGAGPDPADGGSRPAGGWSGYAVNPGGYTGPPPTTPPPLGWRPPVYVQAPPPRRLPAQDMATMDKAEQQAQRLTYSFGAVAAVVLVLLTCLLCGRLIF